MLSQSSQPKPGTLRKRLQQYRRRHSISCKSPQETQPSSPPLQKLSDLPPQRKDAHDHLFPKRPQPAVVECHSERQKPSRQGQPASKAHSQSPGPPVTGQSARVAKFDKTDRVQPNATRRRSHDVDCRSKTSSALSQQPVLGLRRRASSAQRDTAAANGSNTSTIGTSAAPRANDGRSGCEARSVAATG